jgi:hypothetical protein
MLLELDCGLTFVIDRIANTEYRRNRIEQPSHARGYRRIN